MSNRNWGKAKSFDDIIAVADAASKLAEETCPEASLIRLAEKIAQRHISIEEAPELASHRGDGLLFVFKDLTCPIVICAPPMKDDPAFFRFTLYHELAHIIFGDVNTLDPPDTEDPYQETDEEWLRAVQFAIRMMCIHWKSTGKDITISEILDFFNSHKYSSLDTDSCDLINILRCAAPHSFVERDTSDLLNIGKEQFNIEPLKKAVAALIESWDDSIIRISWHTDVCIEARKLREAVRSARNTPFYFALIEIDDCIRAVNPEDIDRSMADTYAACVQKLSQSMTEADMNDLTDHLYQVGFRPWQQDENSAISTVSDKPHYQADSSEAHSIQK